jgi:cation diffusion facilitator CzcD-associated flavoprotein CzcO
VAKAIFDEQRGRWQVTTTDGRVYHARTLISASGGLSRPSYPDIPGIERFAGKTFHTARWDHEYALDDKAVAVIGTGASAIQVVPSIISRVKQLKLFQRTPPWVLPKPDMRIGARQQQRFAKYPWFQRLIRHLIYWLLESRALGFTGVLPGMQKRFEKRARQHLAEQISDPELRARLTPNYRIGCKRVLIANDYYAALQRDNAEVVSEGIREIREHAVVTTDGQEHAVDAIVFATGFQAAEHISPFEVIGRNGQDLNQQWREGAEAYLGTAVAGFPNFFLVTGPNTGLGHNSMVFMIESQIQYVMDSLRTMRERGLRWVEVKRRVQAAYNKHLHERLGGTVWATGGCVSWYRTKTGKNTTLWPGFTFEFRWRTRRFDAESYLQSHERSQAERAREAAESEHPGRAAVREDRPQV